jgi:hypothetical protein
LEGEWVLLFGGNDSPNFYGAITGEVNGDGIATIQAIVGGATDQGAEPNQLVVITDGLSWKSEADAAGEAFNTLRTAEGGTVLRRVSFVPS